MRDQSKKTIRITSTGTWLSSSNIGDNAIFTGILDALDIADFTVLTSDPDRVRSIYQVQAFSPKQHLISTIISIIKSDYFLFTGGTPFFNDPLHMAYYAGLAVLAKCFGKPVIVFGVSYRQTTGLALFFIKLILRIAIYVGARELVTFNQFYELVKNKEKVKFLPDPGFSLIPAQIKPKYGFINKLVSDPITPKIGICLRNLQSSEKFQDHHYSTKFSQDLLHSFYKYLAQFVEYLVEKDQARVFFLPMHIHDPDDDRKAANQVVQLIDNDSTKKRVIAIDKQLTPRDMKWVFQKLNLVVGVRFHSIVLSTSVNTPIISIEYAKKNQSLLQLLDLSHYSTKVEDVTDENLIFMYNQFKEDRSAILTHLKSLNKHFQKTYQEELKKIIPELIAF